MQELGELSKVDILINIMALIASTWLTENKTKNKKQKKNICHLICMRDFRLFGDGSFLVKSMVIVNYLLLLIFILDP
jgi:hypothetical protein